jgi:glycosyltransferase involved in cell wall biosynthesis
MLVGIDGNEANVTRKVGIGEYSFELLQQFKEFRISDFKFQIYLKSHPRAEMPSSSENWKYTVFGPKKFWTQFGLPFNLYLRSPKPDVFFSPSHYAPRFSPVPTVISVMDVSYNYFPELFRRQDLYQLEHWTKYSVQNAKKVLTISEASKNDIIKLYHVDSKKVVVTYPGIKKESRSMNNKSREELQKKYGVEGKYILFVGTLQPRKNIVKLIEAFAKLVQNSDSGSLSLVIVGKKGWLYEEILDTPKKFGVEDLVTFLDFVPDEDLPSLYKHAEFFILPSLYEGFGLPVLEAMSYGCPVITSNVSSLPEAAGDAALYVDPTDIVDIEKKMQKLLSDKSLRAKLIEKGHEQVKKFSWEKTAKQTLDVLQEVAVKA